MKRESLRWVERVPPAVIFGVLTAGCASAQNDVTSDSRSNDDANGRNPAIEGNPPSGAEGPATLEAFYSEYAELNCQHTTECYGVALAVYCDHSESWFEDYYGPKAANLVYHRAEAADCLAALRKSECGDLGQFTVEACRRVIEGPGKQNDSCTGTIDCGLELYCKDDEQCPGVCLPRARAGQDCTVSPCLEELTCTGDLCSAPAGGAQAASLWRSTSSAHSIAAWRPSTVLSFPMTAAMRRKSSSAKGAGLPDSALPVGRSTVPSARWIISTLKPS